MHGRRYWLLFLHKVRVRLPAVDRATDSVELSTDTGVRLVIRRVYDSFGLCDCALLLPVVPRVQRLAPGAQVRLPPGVAPR